MCLCASWNYFNWSTPPDISFGIWSGIFCNNQSMCHMFSIFSGFVFCIHSFWFFSGSAALVDVLSGNFLDLYSDIQPKIYSAFCRNLLAIYLAFSRAFCMIFHPPLYFWHFFNMRGERRGEGGKGGIGGEEGQAYLKIQTSSTWRAGVCLPFLSTVTKIWI